MLRSCYVLLERIDRVIWQTEDRENIVNFVQIFIFYLNENSTFAVLKLIELFNENNTLFDSVVLRSAGWYVYVAVC